MQMFVIALNCGSLLHSLARHEGEQSQHLVSAAALQWWDFLLFSYQLDPETMDSAHAVLRTRPACCPPHGLPPLGQMSLPGPEPNHPKSTQEYAPSSF